MLYLVLIELSQLVAKILYSTLIAKLIDNCILLVISNISFCFQQLVSLKYKIVFTVT